MLVLNQNTQRDTGRSAQLANIGAAQAVAGIVRSTLGPRAMLKMLLDPMGGIVITNDANAILREVDVSHPAAKQMIELSRAQDEEVGDGLISASRRVEAPSRHRRASSPGEEVVGGLVFDFEAIRTALRDRDAPRRCSGSEGAAPRAEVARTVGYYCPKYRCEKFAI